jgi:hypothetical protein
VDEDSPSEDASIVLRESPAQGSRRNSYGEIPVDGAVVGSGVFGPMLGTALGKAVVGSGVLYPMLGTAPR